jgi:uncharacterized protein DUF3224
MTSDGSAQDGLRTRKKALTRTNLEETALRMFREHATTIDGRAGSSVFTCHGADPAADRVEGTWTVLPGSGTGALTGLRGRGEFTARRGADGVWRAEDAFHEWFA